MSTTESLTPAQKAEARRLKILAKKNARMAYASGDRSILPKQAPPEPVQPIPTSTSNPNLTTNNQHQQEELQPIHSKSSFSAQSSHQIQASSTTFLISHRVRRLCLAFVAIFYAICSNTKFDPFIAIDFNLSLIEIFLLAQFAIFAPTLIIALPNLFSYRHTNSSNSSKFNIFISVVQKVHMLYKVTSVAVSDFSVYFLSFLCIVYALDST